MAYYESIQKLFRAGLNVPEVVIHLSPDGGKDREYLRTAALASLKAMQRGRYKVILVGKELPDEITYNNPTSLSHLFEEQGGNYDFNEEVNLIKAPKSEPLVKGVCCPTPYWNKINIDNSGFRNVIWGVSKELPFPVGLRRAVLELNSLLQPKRMEFDGAHIRFSFHTRPEGVLGERILLWGIHKLGETIDTADRST